MVGPARRRGAELEQAIVDAAIEQLCEVGWNALTMEGVAGGAHTGKAAVYRRWSSKAELVADALRASLPPLSGIPDTGSIRGDLGLLVRSMRDVMHSRPGQALRSVLHECDDSSSAGFQDIIRTVFLEPSGRLFQVLAERGIERGDVRPDATGAFVADVIPAMMMYRTKVCGSEWEDSDIEEFVDRVLVPLLRR
ncbi:TetR/AcrR family transcriptional regulator [Streptomyces sp. NPDC051211]|uniref:TetR/AcrR family transcriptional regulator n=1 Tax=Streptomyces sp. NPDC051211 TaxID=3154643 RepID=UPI00344B95B4